MGTSTVISKHLLILSTISLAIGIIYANVSVTYFCAEDDFIEIHLAAFEDVYAPSQVFTTSHFHSYRYRPLNRAINLLTYSIGDGNSILFRVRNIVFHILSVIFVYILGFLLFKNMYISIMAAVLFGLNPLANQSVAGAIMTNVIAHTGFLAALVMFIISLRAKRFWWQLLVISLVIAWLSLLTYDSEIVIFGMMLLYLGTYSMTSHDQQMGWRFIAVFATASSILAGIYFSLRTLFVPYGWGQAVENIPTVSDIVKNLAMYIFALLLPVDSVLANEWLNTPLPSEIELNTSTAIAAIMIAFGAILIAAFIIWRWKNAKLLAIQATNWPTILFLICGIFLPLLPVLVLSSHSSETYLYLSVAFYSLLLSCILAQLFYGSPTLKGRTSVVATFLVLLGLFCAATWIRNERVVQCGETAYRLLYGLPGEQLTDGAWRLSFANMAGGERSRRYGLYGFRGIDTIVAAREGIANTAITSALQFVYKNELLTGEVLRAEELIAKCSSGLPSHHLCLWVHWDGRLEELRKHTAKEP